MMLGCLDRQMSYQSTKRAPRIFRPWPCPWTGSSSLLQNVTKTFYQYDVIFQKFRYSSESPWKSETLNCWFSVRVRERGLFLLCLSVCICHLRIWKKFEGNKVLKRCILNETFLLFALLSRIKVLHVVRCNVKYNYVTVHFHSKIPITTSLIRITKRNINVIPVSNTFHFSCLTVVFQSIFSKNYLHFPISEVQIMFFIVSKKAHPISFFCWPFAVSWSVHITHTLTERLANRGTGKRRWVFRGTVFCASRLIN